MGIESLHTAAAAAGYAMATSEDLLVAEPHEKSSARAENINPWGARDMSEPKSGANLPALRPAAQPLPGWSQVLVRGVYSLMRRGAPA
jgi:hypothetical protein